MEMSKHIPTQEKRPKKIVGPHSSFPSRNREALARKIQTIDGFSRREAEMQINALAAEFRESTEQRQILHLPSFYRTGMSVL